MTITVETIARLAAGADIPDAGYTGPEAFFGIGGVAAFHGAAERGEDLVRELLRAERRVARQPAAQRTPSASPLTANSCTVLSGSCWFCARDFLAAGRADHIVEGRDLEVQRSEGERQRLREVEARLFFCLRKTHVLTLWRSARFFHVFCTLFHVFF